MNKKAVALKYEAKKHRAPEVVAKGSDEIAEKILEIARAHGVPLYENSGLLKKIYSLEVGEVVPQELYELVAVILAWVYSMDKKEAR